MTKNRLKIGLVKAAAIFLAMEMLVFLLAAALYFAIGVADGGIQAGIRMASGALYSWFAFAMLCFAGWIACLAALACKGKSRSPEKQN